MNSNRVHFAPGLLLGGTTDTLALDLLEDIMTDLLTAITMLSDFERADEADRLRQWPMIEQYIHDERIPHLVRKTLHRGLMTSQEIDEAWAERIAALEIGLTAERLGE